VERLVVGLVRGLHGTAGGVRVEPLTDDPQRFRPGDRLALEGEPVELTVAWSQPSNPGILVRFEEIADREEAEHLRGRYLEVEQAASALPEGAFWWHELEGVTVTSTDGQPLGRVSEVFRAGGGEVLLVHGGAHGELLIPLVRSVVRELAPREGRIVVDVARLDLPEPRPARDRARRASSGSARPRRGRTVAARREGKQEP
jgi:16S rRNA processing protein RimM